MDLNPASAAADDAGAELALASLPPELAIQIGAMGGFVTTAELAGTCRAYAGMLRAVVTNAALLGPALRATGRPRWLHWLVAHAQALRSRGASGPALACVAVEGARSLEGEGAVRLLGLAVQHGELGLFSDAATGAETTDPLLQRARAAAVLAAPPPQPEQVAAPHLAALEWHCRQQQLAAADPPYTVGAVASLAEPAAAEAQLVEVGRVMDVVCSGGQAAVQLLQLLLACDAFLARLDSTGAYIIMVEVCNRGEAELLRLLLARDAFLAQLTAWDIDNLIVQQAGARGQLELLQQLLACDALVERVSGPGTVLILQVVCSGEGQDPELVLQKLLACDAFLARLDSMTAALFMLEECRRGQQDEALQQQPLWQLRQLLASDAFLARLHSQAATIVLDQVCWREQADVLRQLLACDAFLARLDSGGARSVLENVRRHRKAEAQQQLLACEAFVLLAGGACACSPQPWRIWCPQP